MDTPNILKFNEMKKLPYLATIASTTCFVGMCKAKNFIEEETFMRIYLLIKDMFFEEFI